MVKQKVNKMFLIKYKVSGKNSRLLMNVIGEAECFQLIVVIFQPGEFPDSLHPSAGFGPLHRYTDWTGH